jgi:hypothetical protein
MKILITVLIFALTLALTLTPSLKALASEEAHGGHEELTEKMNSLFPEKQANMTSRTAPGKPALTSPTFFAVITGNNVKLQWTAVQEAEEYHVQVATDPNFKWIVKEDFAHKESSFDLTDLEAGKQYFWRVSAVKPNNWKTFRKSYFATSMFETTAVK